MTDNIQMYTNEKKDILELLKKNDTSQKMCQNDIPHKYRDDKEIIELERQIGMRIIERKGFDVINQVYFVHESVLHYIFSKGDEDWRDELKTFKTFNHYYEYINGDIYDNACYYQCNSLKLKKIIGKSKLREMMSLIDYNIDDFNAMPSPEEETLFLEGEKRKKSIKKWIAKFNACDSLEMLLKTVDAYNRSVLSKRDGVELDFFFWQYIFCDLNDKRRFEIVMQYMSTGQFPAYRLIQPLCHVYDPKEVLSSYDYSLGAETTCERHKKKLRTYIEEIGQDEEDWHRETEVFFDSDTHYYCECDSYGVYRYFETFEELVSYRNYDLTNTDLTEAINLAYDFSECIIDETTKLPINDFNELKYVVKKEYTDNVFTVLQEWYNTNGVLVKNYEHKFDYFFDFVAFLKGDLSDADLILCDGLKNLKDISEIDFTNAKITSAICDRFGINYERYSINSAMIESFLLVDQNEKNTQLELNTTRNIIEVDDSENLDFLRIGLTKERIQYISDLHLMHKLDHYKAKSKMDVVYVIKTIVNRIVSEVNEILLIGGDVSSDHTVFELFVRLLKDELDRKHKHPIVIFVLGNHELWDFPKLTFEEIVKKYVNLLDECGMYLLQNNIIFKDIEDRINNLSSEEINSLTYKDIRNRLRTARIVFFGGLAFSGYNKKFNANNGIYRETILREQEIEESRHFEKLYNRVLEVIPDKKVVVFTHTPMDCWRDSIDYHKDYVYVSGHTHRNQFYDDGETRLYADNQIGYANNSLYLKWFDLDNEYDFFSDYDDGIHPISSDDYRQFYRGKNIGMSFNRTVNVLYMLKKNGYYCFIHESTGGSLTILHGGALKRLDRRDIEYYYDNMDAVISTIKKPLDKYTEIQEKVAVEIRKLGGVGKIHGCIIDIDWYNHIYINPVDMKITGYWASDIINKKVYANVPELLKNECPAMYMRYVKKLKGKSDDLPILASLEKSNNDIALLPQIYLATDIYMASREIKKMQRLESNILTTWYEIDNKKLIENKSDT